MTPNRQRRLPFHRQRTIVLPPRLVTLSAQDEAFIERFKREDRFEDFLKCRIFLMEARAQRLGCSPGCLEAMQLHDLNRHLADEAWILWGDRPWHEPPAHIDWDKINAIAKRRAAEGSHNLWDLHRLENYRNPEEATKFLYEEGVRA